MQVDASDVVVRHVKSTLMREYGDRPVKEEWIESQIEETIFEKFRDLSIDEMKQVKKRSILRLRSPLGILLPLVQDQSINEIMVNGIHYIFVERRGNIEKVDDYFASQEELTDIIRYIAGKVHREFNELNPIVDARLEDGSRVCGVYSNVAIGGPALSIRKFKKEKMTMDYMVEIGSISKECGDELHRLVKAGYNIFVSGGTSSGKTTFLNALSDFIGEDERIIVIEDSSELNMSQVENIIYMECKNANSIGKGQVDMASLIKTSLRLRPDRIIVGEVRGGEVFQMIQAMNSGHSGSMSTGHGNSVEGMLRRLESMYLMAIDIPVDAIRMQIAEAIDIMVHLNRNKDGKRAVESVAELVGYRNGEYKLNYIYELDENLKLVSTGNRLKNSMRLRQFSGDNYISGKHDAFSLTESLKLSKSFKEIDNDEQ